MRQIFARAVALAELTCNSVLGPKTEKYMVLGDMLLNDCWIRTQRSAPPCREQSKALQDTAWCPKTNDQHQCHWPA